MTRLSQIFNLKNWFYDNTTTFLQISPDYNNATIIRFIR